jgi:hypothetical protein
MSAHTEDMAKLETWLAGYRQDLRRARSERRKAEIADRIESIEFMISYAQVRAACANCGRPEPAYIASKGRFCDWACHDALALNDPHIGAQQLRNMSYLQLQDMGLRYKP